MVPLLIVAWACSTQDQSDAATLPGNIEGAWRFRSGDDPAWAKPDFDDGGWRTLHVPGTWEAQGLPQLDGFAWYRRTFHLPRLPQGEKAVLLLGKIDDADETYINGVKIGASGSMNPPRKTAWQDQRLYLVPRDALRQGSNVLAVRVCDFGGGGGIFEGPLVFLWEAEADFYLDLKRAPKTGFPCANFGICGEIASNGRIWPSVYVNPSEQGQWLRELGGGQLSLEESGRKKSDNEFTRRRLTRAWPFASIALEDDAFPGLQIEIRAHAPVALGDAFTSSLPVLSTDITLVNTSPHERQATLRFRWMAADSASFREASIEGFEGVSAGRVFIGFDGACARTVGRLPEVTKVVRIPARGSAPARLLLARHDSQGPYVDRLATLEALVGHASRQWAEVRQATAEFERHLPRTGDPVLDGYVRWYMVAGVALTKLFRNGDVVTLGYTELNQRDSFWTSWLHLVYWPELERRMIEESAAHQRGDGKIPTTILPTIEREDDIDINEYFILRVMRWFEWRRDRELLRKLWPSVKRAIEYLKGRDRDGDSVPDQGSCWADWKDVEGMEGRQYSPHFALLWLAVLRRAADAADVLDDAAASRQYRRLYETSAARIHAPVDKGGLWDGRCYVNRWRDGRADSTVAEEQCVGALFGVIPDDRVGRVFEALRANETKWGVRESYPYRPESFGFEPGDYHNGGIWPFLNSVDAFARFTCGASEDGLRILKKIGWSDLEAEGDFLPNEIVHGETGKNIRWWMQGWDAAYFAAVAFGALGVRRLSDDEIEIMPRLPRDREFATRLLLPEGVLEVERRKGVVSVRSALKRDIELRHGTGARTSLKSGATVVITAD
ncbi:MAG: hypothetical protein HYY16_12960 [Planctomycetes bacterium]|nr:hypothetical protein [Planctomycetota bacterium]